MGGERGEEKRKREGRERGKEEEGKNGVGTVGLKPSQSKISGHVTARSAGTQGSGASNDPPPGNLPVGSNMVF